MAIYASAVTDEDKEVPRRLGEQLGLLTRDANLLADEDGITRITVTGAKAKAGYIPYTNHRIRWHTDGYYNPPEQRIRAMLLHCVRDAAAGGDSALLDHELAYILLREDDPGHVRALMEPDALTIPARVDDEGVARPAAIGPGLFRRAGNGRPAHALHRANAKRGVEGRCGHRGGGRAPAADPGK